MAVQEAKEVQDTNLPPHRQLVRSQDVERSPALERQIQVWRWNKVIVPISER